MVIDIYWAGKTVKAFISFHFGNIKKLKSAKGSSSIINELIKDPNSMIGLFQRPFNPLSNIWP